MGATYCSFWLATAISLLGTGLLIIGVFAERTMCPPFRKQGTEDDALVYESQSVETLLTEIIFDGTGEVYYEKIHGWAGFTMGVILHDCSNDTNLLNMLNVNELESHNGSAVERYQEFYYHRNEANLTNLLQQLISNTTMVPFTPELLAEVRRVKEVLEKKELEDSEKQVSMEIFERDFEETLDELGSIAAGLSGKSPEQQAMEFFITKMDQDVRIKLNSVKVWRAYVLNLTKSIRAQIARIDSKPREFLDAKAMIESNARGNATGMTARINMFVQRFINRTTHYMDNFTDYAFQQSAKNSDECEAILKSFEEYGHLICDCIISHLVLMGVCLMVASLIMAPCCIIAICLSRQLLILEESDHFEDHYEVGIPPAFRKFPRKKRRI